MSIKLDPDRDYDTEINLAFARYEKAKRAISLDFLMILSGEYYNGEPYDRDDDLENILYAVKRAEYNNQGLLLELLEYAKETFPEYAEKFNADNFEKYCLLL